MILFSFIFSITATVIFWLGLNIFSEVDYEATFLVSQAVLYTTIPLFPVETIHQYRARFFTQFPGQIAIPISIVLITVLISMVNLYVYQDHILMPMEDPLVRRIYQLFSYTFIPFAQVGGWLYQSLMVFFIAVILGTKLSFKKYLSFVGLSYMGFLISTLLSLFLNVLIIDFSFTEDNVSLRYAIGKFGEALAMILLVFFIFYNETRFGLVKSCLTACLPTVVVILFQIIL
jgi:hypothetical protein